MGADCMWQLLIGGGLFLVVSIGELGMGGVPRGPQPQIIQALVWVFSALHRGEQAGVETGGGGGGGIFLAPVVEGSIEITVSASGVGGEGRVFAYLHILSCAFAFL